MLAVWVVVLASGTDFAPPPLSPPPLAPARTRRRVAQPDARQLQEVEEQRQLDARRQQEQRDQQRQQQQQRQREQREQREHQRRQRQPQQQQQQPAAVQPAVEQLRPAQIDGRDWAPRAVKAMHNTEVTFCPWCRERTIGKLAPAHPRFASNMQVCVDCRKDFDSHVETWQKEGHAVGGRRRRDDRRHAQS